HDEGPREIKDLHVPVGRTVKLIMTSQDAIHDFFVPAFRVKRDVLPGRYQSIWFEATKTGEFHLFCAEFCGTQHPRMRGRVIVMKAEDFAAWKQLDRETSPAIAGGRLYQRLACASC